MLIFYKEFFFIYHLSGRSGGFFFGAGVGHMILRGERSGAQEKFNSRMPYL